MGSVVAIASWKPYFSPPSPGPDPSWQAGLYMAVDQGLDFGRDLIYTWGPLGFIGQAQVVPYYVELAVVAGIFQGLLHLALCVSLVWVLRPRFGLLIAAALALGVALLPLDSVLVLGLALCLAALAGDPPHLPARLLPVGGGVVAGIECLVTPRWGPALFAACSVTLLVLEDRRRRLALFGGVFLATLLSLWLVLGHGLGGLDDLVSRWAQVVSGYSQASGIEIDTPGWQKPAAALAAGAVLTGTYLIFRELPRPRGLAALGIVALVLFGSFKEGFVVHDSFHAASFFATVAGAGAALPWRTSQRLPALVLIAALLAVGVAALPAGTERFLNPWKRARGFDSYARTLVQPSKLEQFRDDGRRLMIDYYRIDPRTLELLRGHTVHVDPWEAGAAWAYKLDWRPLPVFQDYLASTVDLDRWNAEALSSPDGPERILRENTAVVDPSFATYANRIHSWDPPAAALAMLCHFRPLRTTQRWQALERTPDRCGAPRRIGSLEARYGAPVDVPRLQSKGEVVFARVHGAGVEGLERLRTLLYRAAARHVIVNDDPTPHRLVPGTAADGLLLNAPGDVDFPPPFALAPAARTLVFRKGSSSDPLEVDFYAMPVRPLRGPGDLPSAPGSG
ncbi:MAG: hypothetical protein AABM29_04675 [Actinomycetota bacterium]